MWDNPVHFTAQPQIVGQILGGFDPSHGFFSVLLAGFQHIIIHHLFQIRGILGVDDPIKPAFWQSIDPALVVNLQFVPQQNHFGQILFQNGFGQLYNLGIGTVYKAEDGFIQIFCPSAYFVELIHDGTTE